LDRYQIVPHKMALMPTRGESILAHKTLTRQQLKDEGYTFIASVGDQYHDVQPYIEQNEAAVLLVNREAALLYNF